MKTKILSYFSGTIEGVAIHSEDVFNIAMNVLHSLEETFNVELPKQFIEHFCDALSDEIFDSRYSAEEIEQALINSIEAPLAKLTFEGYALDANVWTQVNTGLKYFDYAFLIRDDVDNNTTFDIEL